MCFAPQQHTFWTPELPKALRTRGVFSILSWKCASDHSGVRFGPQRRALLPRLNFQKCSETEVFLDVFSILASKCASRHSSLQFLIFHLPRRRRYLFAALIFPCSDSFLLWSSFFFLPLLWLFPPLLFHPSILTEIWLQTSFDDIIWYMLICVFVIFCRCKSVVASTLTLSLLGTDMSLSLASHFNPCGQTPVFFRPRQQQINLPAA